MKNKKIYSSPEIEVTRFSFESILYGGGDTDDVESYTIKQSVGEYVATGGDNGDMG